MASSKLRLVLRVILGHVMKNKRQFLCELFYYYFASACLVRNCLISKCFEIMNIWCDFGFPLYFKYFET